jgi:hypothetical protein
MNRRGTIRRALADLVGVVAVFAIPVGILFVGLGVTP